MVTPHCLIVLAVKFLNPSVNKFIRTRIKCTYLQCRRDRIPAVGYSDWWG